MTPRAARALALAVALASALTASGCAGVEPWQRSSFAQPHMQSDHDRDLHAIRQHVYRSREAAAPRARTSGGGCGCY